MNLRKILLFQIHNEIVLYSSGEQGRLGCEYIEGGHFIIKFEQDLYISYLIHTADLSLYSFKHFCLAQKFSEIV